MKIHQPNPSLAGISGAKIAYVVNYIVPVNSLPLACHIRQRNGRGENSARVYDHWLLGSLPLFSDPSRTFLSCPFSRLRTFVLVRPTHQAPFLRCLNKLTFSPSTTPPPILSPLGIYFGGVIRLPKRPAGVSTSRSSRSPTIFPQRFHS